MAKISKLCVPMALAAGLIALSAAPASAAPVNSAPAAVSITITATSPHFPGAVHGKVFRFALVVYKFTANKLNTGIVSGRVTGAGGGVAALLSEPFGAKQYTATGARVKLSGSPARYAFSVTPSVATRYKVQVSAKGKAAATSVSATVWVTLAGVVSHQHKKCSPAVNPNSCAFSYQVQEKVPAAAYTAETRKHFYLYQAVGYPTLPKVFTLSKTATHSKVKKINSGEFEIVLTFHIPLRHHQGQWLTTFCTKDNESRDGLGLPGHHGCGNNTVKLSAIYVG